MKMVGRLCKSIFVFSSLPNCADLQSVLISITTKRNKKLQLFIVVVFVCFYSLCGHGLKIRAIVVGTYPRYRGTECNSTLSVLGHIRAIGDAIPRYPFWDISAPSGF